MENRVSSLELKSSPFRKRKIRAKYDGRGLEIYSFDASFSCHKDELIKLVEMFKFLLPVSEL